MKIIITKIMKDLIHHLNIYCHIYTLDQYNLFKAMKIGDVCYAKMPLSKRELNAVPIGHKNRPYLIIGKTTNYLIGYYCTSCKPTKKEIYKYYQYKKIIYTYNKDSYFHLDQVFYIPIKNIIKPFGSLIEKDKKEIQKRIHLSNINGNQLPNFDSKIDLSIGDIITFNNKMYYIYQIDSLYMYTYEVSIHKENSSEVIPICIHKSLYYIFIRRQEIMKHNTKVNLVYICSKEQINNIDITKKAIKKRRNNVNTKKDFFQLKYEYEIGQILQIGQFVSYIYLYTCNKRMYGVYWPLEDDLQIIRIKTNEYLDIAQLISSEDILYILNVLKSKNTNQKDVLKNVYNHYVNNKSMDSKASMHVIRETDNQYRQYTTYA